jgi:hypothetical protein
MWHNGFYEKTHKSEGSTNSMYPEPLSNFYSHYFEIGGMVFLEARHGYITFIV